MADVFVSYSRDDRARVEQLAHALEARGFDVWWDPELLPGEKYADKIGTVLNSCKAVIVVWSAASTGRPWVLDEAAVGRDRGVLVPVVVDNAVPPLGFRQMQAEDLSQWPGADGEANFERLVRALEHLRGQPARPGLAQTPVIGAAAKKSGDAGGNKRRWPMLLGAAALAVLGIAAIVQIVSPPSSPKGSGADTELFGLTQREYATAEPTQLVQAAIDRRGLDALREGAEAGAPVAEELLCLAYDYGVGVEADADLARTWCAKASAGGSRIGRYVEALALYYGHWGLTQDQLTAAEQLKTLAQEGDARAQYFVGTGFLNGDSGFPADDRTALGYLRQAAMQGHPSGQFNLAWMYENGRGAETDHATALLWYQKLADEGSPIGIRAVGWMTENGFGTAQDLAKAAELYQQASDLGDANAANNLANLYETGRGVEKNLDEAVRLYKLAESRNYTQATESLKRLGFAD